MTKIKLTRILGSTVCAAAALTAVTGVFANPAQAAGVAITADNPLRSPLLWNIYDMPDGSTWNSLASDGKSTWIAVGTKGGAAVSKDDGVTWAWITPLLPGNAQRGTLDSVEYADGVWIATGNGLIIRSTTNGDTWTDVTPTGTSTSRWTGAAHGENTWVAFSEDFTQKYAISKDKGETWTVAALPYKFAITDVAYSPIAGKWAAVGSGFGSVAKHILVSEEGATWEWASNAAASWIDVVTGQSGNFVALSSAGAISTSTDGVNWSEASYPLPQPVIGSVTWTKLSAGPDGYLAVGYGYLDGQQTGFAAYSANGSEWTPTNIPQGTWHSVAADDNGFVALSTVANGQAIAVRGLLAAPDSQLGYANTPWVQAYARTEGGTCNTGWAPSWAEWVNEGKGGFTCERTVAYSPGHKGFMVFVGGQWFSAPDAVYSR